MRKASRPEMGCEKFIMKNLNEIRMKRGQRALNRRGEGRVCEAVLGSGNLVLRQIARS